MSTPHVRDKLRKLVAQLTVEQRNRLYEMWLHKYPNDDWIDACQPKEVAAAIGLCNRTIKENQEKADATVLAALEEMRRDAERYRWIRKHHNRDFSTVGVYWDGPFRRRDLAEPIDFYSHPGDGMNLDRSLDWLMHESSKDASLLTR